MPGFSLESVKKSADVRYGPFVITMGEGQEDVVLLPYLRLSPEKRRAWDNRQGPDEITAAAANGDASADVADYFINMIRIVATDDDHADRILSEIGHDPAAMTVLLEEYVEQTRQGEVAPSPS